MTKALDLTGKVFGDLTVVCRMENDRHGKSVWLWECSCGSRFSGVASTRRNSVLKCRTCVSKHVGFKSRKYEQLGNYKSAHESWRGMKDRCNNPNNNHYKNYGLLGIKVCDRWLGDKGFINFFEDMGERPQGMTIDRIDVNKGYSPENCRWADNTTQAYNTKREHLNKSGRVGVRYEVRHGRPRWIATISYQNTGIYLGIYNSFEEACKVREEAEIKYYGVTK